MSPAIIRSMVEFPHPEGPRSTRNSRSGIVADNSEITGVSPKHVWIDAKVSSGTVSLSRSRMSGR